MRSKRWASVCHLRVGRALRFEGDLDRGMAEPLGHSFDRATARRERHGVGLPEMVEANAGVLGSGGVLLVANHDRIGRLEPMTMAMIERAVQRKGGRIVSAAGEGTENDDPSSILMRRMVDALAEYERLVIKARTKATLGSKRKRGEKTGGRFLTGGCSENPSLV
jgi:Resolvase, N terminal domain